MTISTLRNKVLWSTLFSCAVTSLVIASALWLEPGQNNQLFWLSLGVCVLGFLMVVPVHVLPTLALVLVFTVSDRLASGSTFSLITPVMAVLAVWFVRRRIASPGRQRQASPRSERTRLERALVILTAVTSAWLVVLLTLHPSLFGISWVVAFLLALMGPHLVGDIGRETHLMREALPWLGGVTAGYAVLQSSLQQNVVFSPLLLAMGRDDVQQHWAVYRSDGSFGHPLVAGLFLAVSLTFCVGRWLETRQPVFILLALVSGLGIISTVSRGAYISTGIAVALIIIVALLGRGLFGRGRLILLGAVFATFSWFALNSSAFVSRGLSDEAIDSSAVRANLPAITFATARAYHWLGSGPGSSLAAAAPFNYQGLRIENSYFQLLISLGLPGLVLFVLVMALALLTAIRLGNLGAAAGLMALAVGASGFAALDTPRNILVLLGLMVMLAVHHDEADVPPVGTAGVGVHRHRHSRAVIAG